MKLALTFVLVSVCGPVFTDGVTALRRHTVNATARGLESHKSVEDALLQHSYALSQTQRMNETAARIYLVDTPEVRLQSWLHVKKNTAFWIVVVVMCVGFTIAIGSCIDSMVRSAYALDNLEIFDAMTYKGNAMNSWTVFLYCSGTIWNDRSVWIMTRRLTSLALFVALMELLLARDPSSLDPMRFSQMGNSLQLFVGFLLGFFLSSSVGRWLKCVDSFLDLFATIRNLQMQLHALGVEQEKVDLIMRYGVLSAWLRNHTLKCEGANAEEKQAGLAAMWSRLESHDHDDFIKVLPEEIALLKDCADPASHVWLLVGSFVGRLAQDGDIPPMPSPTYGRIIQLVQTAQDSLKNIKQSGYVQVPFVYTHTLACIVHLNNIVAVTSFGLTLGACTGSILVHLDKDLRLYSDSPQPHHIMIQDFQCLIIQFFKCFFAPILFQAFLEIGICIANPFSSEGADIPTDRLFSELIADIKVSNEIAGKPPCWKKPAFKQPPKPA